ncbi:YhcH/YjgK/YiaL family protein [Streptococcus ictaluri]|uniref:YhcH/YjgK/YiaL family protein n=1 Tax=Streptococcus ictaluri 707-05 TaxID=764299 RepID=G5K4W3_9STRE|nr:YhcH/YjgK/YiaL family protein [Streptococcus ictaluri]EHI68937.1 YhcH/YjgK/YiaL family protein [Streptococcus ictaluri 707-05]
MIYDDISYIHRYKGIHPDLDSAISYLESQDIKQLQEGRHRILDDKIVLFIQKNRLSKDSNETFEYHKRYADLHLLLEGSESIAYGQGACQYLGDFKDQEDIGFMSCDQSIALVLGAGQFAYFYPEEAHQPNGFNHAGEEVVKCLIKVLMTQ